MFPLCESIFFFESANHLFQDIFFDTIKMLKEQFIWRLPRDLTWEICVVR